jgi:NADPH-dependent 2,4-dienoyl-CoA reductase/sulfur reductase-like enzyme
MPNYTYLIVGGGMTASAAVGGIREVDPKGSVGLIGAESHPPYDRPPLSKGLWKGKPLESIWRKIDAQGLALHLGRQARTLDPPNKRVTDDQGTDYTFDKLLLATGGTPISRRSSWPAPSSTRLRSPSNWGFSTSAHWTSAGITARKRCVSTAAWPRMSTSTWCR